MHPMLSEQELLLNLMRYRRRTRKHAGHDRCHTPSLDRPIGDASSVRRDAFVAAHTQRFKGANVAPEQVGSQRERRTLRARFEWLRNLKKTMTV
jgi:hypothetical protein